LRTQQEHYGQWISAQPAMQSCRIEEAEAPGLASSYVRYHTDGLAMKRFNTDSKSLGSEP